MAGETASFEQAAAAKAEKTDEGDKREQSTIAFPYHDLDAAIEVAQAVYNRSGFGSCVLDELAAEMGQVISGTFRVKVGAARTFNLIDKDGRGAVKLSDLGRGIITDDGAAAAKVEAFMAVPLYSKLYDAYKGQKLPPMKALEREMAALGVAAKQTDKARQAFERAAKQAGFFDAGSDRLVRPKAEAPAHRRDGPDAGVQNETGGGEQRRERQRSGSGGSGGGSPTDLHPLIQGLLVTLPTPGASWSEAGRKAWLGMAESIFKMIYPSSAQGQPAATASNSFDEDDDLDI
jgi:hypothetical protein